MATSSRGSASLSSRPSSSFFSTSHSGARSNSLKQTYLVLYNALSALLWLAVLGRVLLLVPLVGFSHVHGGVGEFVKWTQTLAGLEVVHSLLGLVRSPVSTTLMQVSSRILLVWGIVHNFPSLAESPAYSSMLVAWSVTEVIRYSYFVTNLQGRVPGALTWLRYNTFYVLYPLGISSECWLIYRAIEPAGKVRQEYDWALRAILLAYIPGSYVLYTHMMSQRRKVLRGKGRER